MDFFALMKNTDLDYSKFPQVKLAILANSSTPLLCDALRAQAYEASIDLNIRGSQNDNIQLQVLDEELVAFRPDFIAVLFCVQHLQEEFEATPIEKRQGLSAIFIARLEQLISAIKKNNPNTSLLLFNFPISMDFIFGNFATLVKDSFFRYVTEINLTLMDFAHMNPSTFLCNVSALCAEYGNSAAIDPRLYFEANMAFSTAFLVPLSKQIMDIIQVQRGKIKKCLVLDLDNTIWGGNIGDIGIESIEIGGWGRGKAFQQFQRWMLELKRRGIILVVCSKNDELTAKEPFERHPEMILRLSDIAIFMANWNSKVDNLQSIKSALNIDFEAIVFLDDSPFERNLIRAQLPDVCVPEMPEDPADYLVVLGRMNLFEVNSLSSEDAKRTKFYHNETLREESRQKFFDLSQYLASLQMACEIQDFNRFNLSRISQLIQRSNQFNLRTIRYSEAEILHISQSIDYHPFACVLSDKFGNYGLVSIIILKCESDKLFMDTWIMSCRVLQRDLESFVLNQIVKIARAKKIKVVVGEYLQTAKNGLVKDHYLKMGFKAENGRWQLIVDTYQERDTFIYEIK